MDAGIARQLGVERGHGDGTLAGQDGVSVELGQHLTSDRPVGRWGADEDRMEGGGDRRDVEIGLEAATWRP